MGRSIRQATGYETILGFDPVEYQQQQQKLLQGQFASAQSPYERMGLALGNVFGRAIGGEDATLKRASEVRSIYDDVMTTFDPEAPQKSYVLLGEVLRQRGYGPEATFALNEAAKYNKEKKSPFGQIDVSKFTSESINKFQQTGNYSDLDPLEKPGKGVKVGVTENTGEIIYSDGSQQYIIQNNQRVPFTGKVAEQGGTKINLGLGDALSQMFAKTEGSEKAQAWALAGKVYKDNASILSTIDEFKTTAPRAFTGTGAGAQKELSKALGALGVPIGEKASNTELLQAFSSNFVQKIAKNFPGSQAIKELEQLIQSQPNFKQELPTITRLLDRFRDERLADQLTYQQMSKMPQAQRYAADSNIINVDNYNKILKYRRYQQMFNSKAPMTQTQITEAKQLQAELGLD